MSNAASKIKVSHYAEIPAKYEGKTIEALCGQRAMVKKTTADTGKVDCFICWSKLCERGLML